MQIVAAATTWTLTGYPDDLAPYVAAETDAGRDVLLLRPASSRFYEAASAPWDVMAGALPGHPRHQPPDGGHAQCFLAWLNAAAKRSPARGPTPYGARLSMRSPGVAPAGAVPPRGCG